MFEKIYKKFTKNRTEKMDKEILDGLIKEGKGHLKELINIDQEIICIQKSTKTTFSPMPKIPLTF